VHPVTNILGSDYGYACPDKRVTLSFKWRASRGVAVRRYAYYANGFRFDSHLADFTFFVSFFQAYVLPSRVSVVRLGLGSL